MNAPLAIIKSLTSLLCLAAGTFVAHSVLSFDSGSLRPGFLTCILMAFSTMLSLCLVGTGIALAGEVARSLSQRFLVKPSGLFLVRPMSSIFARWEDIYLIQMQTMAPALPKLLAMLPSQGVVAFFLPGQRTIWIGPEIASQRRLLAFASRIQIKKRLAAEVARIDSGETVSFGALAASSVGIQHGKNTIKWQGIRFVATDNRGASLQLVGVHESFTVKVSKVGNLAILLCIIRLRSDASLDSLPVAFTAIAKRYGTDRKCPKRERSKGTNDKKGTECAGGTEKVSDTNAARLSPDTLPVAEVSNASTTNSASNLHHAFPVPHPAPRVFEITAKPC